MSQPEQRDEDSQRNTPPAGALEGNATLLTFAYDKWFRWSAAIVLLVAVCVVLFISKLFVASTPDVDPPQRISLLDKFQARALIRSARRYAAAGKLRESVTTWISAIVNNPANLDTYRGSLEVLSAQPRVPKEFLGLGYMSGRELLKRNGTNLNDVTLYARFLDRAELYDISVRILRPVGDDLPAETARILARALFFENEMDEFGRLWSRRSADLADAPELALIGTAWAAAWGPPAGMHAARGRLAAARKDLSTGTLASRLQLRVSSKLHDLEAYREALNQLTERHEDTPSDHVELWGLLVRAGRTAEAATLAKNFTRSPENPSEAVRLATVFDSLGMTRFASEFVAAQLADFRYSADLWVLASAIQSKLGEWNQVRQTAISMRSEPSLGGQLTAYSWFLEGLVDIRLNRESAADENFANITGSRFENPQLAARMSAGLRQFGRPRIAAEILRRLEKDFEKDPAFWFELSAAAYESRDMETTALATARAYALKPDNDAYANNHAAVLIALGREAEETVKLTLRLLGKAPGSVDRQINHVLALINARRIEDAEARLRRITPLGLAPAETSVMNYAWFLIHESRGDAALSRGAAARIDRAHLMPPQVEHLEAGIKKVENR